MTKLPPGRFARLALKVNAFLVIAFVLAAGFIGLVSYKQGWFLHQSPIHFITPNALGLNKGMPVKLHGFTVGSVAEMQLTDGGVDVKLLIMSDHMKRILQGSRARHAREAGVIGASVIDIVPGKGPEPLAEGAQIQFEPARGITEIVDDFRRQAIPAFNELKSAMGQVTQAGQDITQILAGLRKEVDQLPATHRAVRGLVQEATHATSDLSFQTTATLDAVERVASRVEHAVPMLSEKLATSIDTINAAAGQLRTTGEAAQLTIKEAQVTLKNAQPLLDRSESAAREANDVLTAAKRVWPISDSFKDTGDGMLPIDSFEARGKGSTR
jgi:phospholipid/cholesterol/gamma-HCH transport system substrate-binding protein